jgi:diacylglycerol kinase family enzyme
VAQFDAARAGNRIFLLMLGCGFDAEVVHRLHSRRTAHVGRWHYLKPFISAVRSYEYPEMQVQWGEGVVCAGETPARPLSARWLFAFNLPCYGGGLRICGQADGTDGLLDVCTFRGGGLWRTIEYIGAALMRQHQRLADFAVHRTQRLRITAEAEVRYQLDGDPGGVLPVEVETLPGRLSALVP